MKKLILVLVAVNFVIIAAVVWHAHYRMPYGVTKTDLSASEVRDAVAILRQERLMWAKLHSLSAHLVIDAGNTNDWYDEKKHVSFECDVLLRQVGDKVNFKSPYLYPYEIILSNKQEGWTITTDGTEKNTMVGYQNKQNGPGIQEIHGMSLKDMAELPTLLIWQKMTLLPCEKDSLCPQSAASLIDILPMWGPWRNQNAHGITHSYVFKDTEGRLPDEMFFTGGHISEYIKKVKNHDESPGKKFSCEKLVEVNGLWFPTGIEWEFNGFKMVVVVSNAAAVMK